MSASGPTASFFGEERATGPAVGRYYFDAKHWILPGTPLVPDSHSMPFSLLNAGADERELETGF